jgi:hypothetical protein
LYRTEELLSMVLANGTTRLQLDIIASSGLPFHALFSSQLLGYTKVSRKRILQSWLRMCIAL